MLFPMEDKFEEMIVAISAFAAGTLWAGSDAGEVTMMFLRFGASTEASGRRTVSSEILPVAGEMLAAPVASRQ
jgi:hypothetical protein